MTIYIEDLKFQTIIGILDFERVQLQDVIINLEIDYNYQGNFINYAEVATSVKEHMQESKFFLIEDALFSISKLLKKQFQLIDKLIIKITKPSIMEDCIVSVQEKYLFKS